MKRTKQVTVFVVIFLLILMFCLFYFNPVITEGRSNYKNSKKIKLGMTKTKMIEIMGKPDTILYGNAFDFPVSYQVYSYSNRFGSSDNINIVIDTNRNVIKVLD